MPTCILDRNFNRTSSNELGQNVDGTMKNEIDAFTIQTGQMRRTKTELILHLFKCTRRMTCRQLVLFSMYVGSIKSSHCIWIIRGRSILS